MPLLLTEYALKPPVSPVPGRFAHLATLVLAVVWLVALALPYAVRKRDLE